MNEQMQQALIKVIEKANSGVDASINFLSDQLPDVVHLLLTWGLLSSIVSCFVCAVVIVSCVFAIKKTLQSIESAKKSKKTNWAYFVYSHSDDGTLEAGSVLALIFSASAIGVSMIVFIANTFAALKIVFAPKIWLIEYAATLTK
jgi:hypothetical protein